MRTHSLLLLVAFLLCFSAVSHADDQIEKLIQQVKGEARYYDASGNELGYFDSLRVRHYDEWCRINAAKLLGKKGGIADKAVDSLIEVLGSGSNDIDTGDGILPLRTEVALALGRINNPKAIVPLIEKLKVSEEADVLPSTSLASNSTRKKGVGHEAIVRALGMFGNQAVDALPVLEELLHATSDTFLKTAIDNTIYRIKHDKCLQPEDFY